MHVYIHTYIHAQELAQAERLYDQGKVDIAMAEFERCLVAAKKFDHVPMQEKIMHRVALIYQVIHVCVCMVYVCIFVCICM
jgi:hypothetical protein